ncbi:MAG: aspartate kinase [Oscillospiraceae bacterium]|nr:aspartate kinase [Oscillospiraceae bacterium]
MSLIVQKFGGSSVANAECIRRVAGIIAETYQAGNEVVVILSAQGDTTDELIAKAKEINPRPSKRELDMLMATGEQMSISLMAMCLAGMGISAVSLAGWQIGMKTNSHYGSARIERVTGERIKKELSRNRVVLVAGFQGVNPSGDITTLGRGGSDTSAVAIAAALHANKCQIYTDVDGVYTADPRKVPGARKLDEITYEEMLELASLGAQVLHNRSVEMAKKYHVQLEVLSSFKQLPGTLVKEVTKQVEQIEITGIAKDTETALFALVGLQDEPGKAFRVFRLLSNAKVNVDVILQSIGRGSIKDISFTVPKCDTEKTLAALQEHKAALGFDRIDVDTTVAKVSIVGAGMVSTPGVAAKMFEALADAKININMISTSEINISVLVNAEQADRAMNAIHDKFFGEQ